MHKKLLLYSCILVFFIWLVNSLANTFYWYSAMWWFDIPMHIMGGMFLALLAGAIFFKRILKLSIHEQFVTLLLFVMIVGLGWECFEYIVQNLIKGGQLANLPDSAKDMVMDILGGSISSIFVLRTLKRYNRRNDKRFNKN